MGEPWPKVSDVSGAHARPMLIGGLQETWPFTLYCTEKSLQSLLKYLNRFPSVHLSRSRSRVLNEDSHVREKEHLTWKTIDLGPNPLTR